MDEGSIRRFIHIIPEYFSSGLKAKRINQVATIKHFRIYLILFLILSQVTLTCSNDNKKATPPPGNDHSQDDPYDIDTYGIPKFVNTNYIELDKIYRISRFRSSVGHDYADNFESCRSMKHYFEPKGTVDWSTVKIYSPIDGAVSRVFEEWAGTQVQIRSNSHPAFFFIIFHISLADSLPIGTAIAEGQQLGTHIGPQTMSDIAVGVNTPHGWKLIPYFEVMTDSLFQIYRSRGVVSRETLIISKEARDSDTLRCNGELFLNQGNLENWVSSQLKS